MLWLAPAGLRGGLKLEAYHQSRQPHTLSLSPSMLWDFGSLYRRRCGVISYALSRQPYFPSLSLRRLRLRVAAQASRTSRSDVSATTDVEASRITSCRGRRVLSAERRCGIAVSLQSRRRRWVSLVGFVVFDFRWRNSREAAPISKLFQGGSTPTITFGSRRRVLYFVMGGPVDSARDGVLPEG